MSTDPCWQDILVSMVQNARNTATRDASIKSILHAIRDGRWADQVEEIRAAYRDAAREGGASAGKRAAEAQKQNLPAFLASGRFSKRANANLVAHSGLICCDLDALDSEIEQHLRVDLMLDPYVAAFFASPTGSGLKVILRIQADASLHLRSFHAAREHFRVGYALEIDESCKDHARLCFVSHDPGLFMRNGDTEILEPAEAVDPAREEMLDDVELTDELRRRINAYLDKVDPAISGEHGSNPTFRLACVLWNGFALSVNDAFPFMQAYSLRCVPPWSAAEIVHKLEDAQHIAHSKPRGHLLREEQQRREPANAINEAIERNGYWWCQDSKRYAIRNEGELTFQVSDEINMMRELAKQGFSRTKPQGDLRSPAEIVLDRIRHTRQVDYIGNVCGRQAGYHEENNGIKILCPTGFTMIEAQDGDCPDILHFWHSLFGKEENPHYEEQTDFMRGWLKSARQALRDYKSEMMGQVVALVGPRDCGKSFFQRLVTAMLSGRVADASNVFVKKSNFNSVLWGAEHLLLGDEELIEAIRDRHPMLPTLKKIVTADAYSFTKKYGDEQTLRPVWRVTISVNDDHDSLRIIPGPEANFGDKISYLRCYAPEEPFHDGSDRERTKWREKMFAQLPCFLHRMIDHFEIPEEKKSSRFTIKHFHHPEVVALVTQSMPTNVFGDILMDWLNNAADKDYDGRLPKRVTGTAVEIYRKMLADGYDFRGICANQISFGARLGHLATTEKWKEHIMRLREIWHIDALTRDEREELERRKKSR